jgi:hypothetical protein
VAELARERHDRVLVAMRGAARSGTFAVRLSAVLEARVVALFEASREGAHGCDLVLCSASGVKSAYGRFRSEEVALVAELLEAGSQAGEFQVEAPVETAELLQRAYASFSPPWVFEEDRKHVLAALRALTALLLNGLLARAAADERRARRAPPGRRRAE